MRTILLTAAAAAITITTAGPAAAEPICVKVAIGVAHTNTFVTPPEWCEDTPFATYHHNGRVKAPEPAYVGYVEFWVRTP